MEQICVIGLGYIGLPTACLLADNGHKVVGVDINKRVVDAVNKGIPPFAEASLNELLSKVVGSGKLTASMEPVFSDVFLIAVPTPVCNRSADLRCLISAIESIIPHLEDGNMVIVESTVPPRTSEDIVVPLLNKSGKKDIGVVYCPERAIPGNTLYEMVNNERIIGSLNKKTGERANRIYRSFVKGETHLTSIRTAETVKLVENTYRDVNIAIANEFAMISEDIGVDVWEVIELANKHPRVNILRPGAGVGGHCIAVDPWFLSNPSTRMINTTREVNGYMPTYVMGLIKKIIPTGSTITVFGLAYKPDVDDTRESPSLKFIEIAEGWGYKIKTYDPYIGGCSVEEAVKDSDCIAIMVNHSYFKTVSYPNISKLMRSKNILDTQNCLYGRYLKEFNVITLGVG